MSTVNESYLVGLIGEGITASLTPPLHEHAAADAGLHYLYRPIDLTALGLTPDDAPRLFKAAVELGYNAFNLTHPVKQTLMPYLDEIDDDARALGAVNTVLVRDGRTIGYNTDFSGYIAGLKQQLGDPDLSKVVQLGSGGAGSAVAYALLRAGTDELTVVDLDERRAGERAADLQRQFPRQKVTAAEQGRLEEALAGATGFAQCTPVGMSIHPGLPVNPGWIPDRAWVSDVIYLPRDTELVTACRQRGMTVADGGGMVVGQAADAFGMITGTEPDRGRMQEYFAEIQGDKSLNSGG